MNSQSTKRSQSQKFSSPFNSKSSSKQTDSRNSKIHNQSKPQIITPQQRDVNSNQSTRPSTINYATESKAKTTNTYGYQSERNRSTQPAIPYPQTETIHNNLNLRSSIIELEKASSASSRIYSDNKITSFNQELKNPKIGYQQNTITGQKIISGSGLNTANLKVQLRNNYEPSNKGVNAVKASHDFRNSSPKLLCFSCKTELKKDKNKTPSCNDHFYCSKCIREPSDINKIHTGCIKCFNSFGKYLNASSKHQNKPSSAPVNSKRSIDKVQTSNLKKNQTVSNQEIEEKIDIESSIPRIASQKINTLENFQSLDSKQASINPAGSIITNNYLTQNYDKKNSYYNSDLSYKIKNDIIQQNQLVNINDKSHISEVPQVSQELLYNFSIRANISNEINISKDLRSSVISDNRYHTTPTRTKETESLNIRIACSVCQRHNPVIGFLCNHNICDECLTSYCCSMIYEFFSEVRVTPDKIKNPFNYYCPAKNCNKPIKVPTLKILTNLKKYLHDEVYKKKFEIYINIPTVLENWIPFFDGLHYDIIFFQNL